MEQFKIKKRFYACIIPITRKPEVTELKVVKDFGKKYVLLFDRYAGKRNLKKFKF